MRWVWGGPQWHVVIYWQDERYLGGNLNRSKCCVRSMNSIFTRCDTSQSGAGALLWGWGSSHSGGTGRVECQPACKDVCQLPTQWWGHSSASTQICQRGTMVTAAAPMLAEIAISVWSVISARSSTANNGFWGEGPTNYTTVYVLRQTTSRQRQHVNPASNPSTFLHNRVED